MTEFIKALKDEGWFNSDVVKLEIKGIEFLKKLWEMSYLSLVSTRSTKVGESRSNCAFISIGTRNSYRIFGRGKS
jgi:hypothetical protein